MWQVLYIVPSLGLQHTSDSMDCKSSIGGRKERPIVAINGYLSWKDKQPKLRSSKSEQDVDSHLLEPSECIPLLYTAGETACCDPSA